MQNHQSITGNGSELAQRETRLIRMPDVTPHLLTNILPNENGTLAFQDIRKTAQDRDTLSGDENRFLEATSNRYRKVISSTEFVLSPVRRVPTELLLEIFAYVLDGDKPVNVLDINRGLWPLTHVCGSWRAAILDHTPFWTTVKISSRSHRSLYAVHILSFYLERSHSRPIFVDFAFYEVSDVTQTLLELLLAQINRWETCRLRVPVQLLMDLPPRVECHPDMLRHLDLNIAFNESAEISSVRLTGIAVLKNLFMSARALRSVIYRVHLITPTFVTLPWPQLTHYDGTSIRPDDHFIILRLLSSVVECNIDCDYPWRRIPDAEILSLKKLRRLKLGGTAPLLLEFIIAPSLQSLSVQLDSDIGVSMQSFLTRSNCHLQELQVHSDLLDNRILSVLPFTPHLVKLDLHISVDTNSTMLKDLFIALKYVPAISECKLPCLKKLRFSVYHDLHEAPYMKELVATVVSRWNLPATDSTTQVDLARLKSFTLETNGLRHSVFDPLWKLIRGGMEVDIRSMD